jgi:hypothetical protein
MKPRASDKAGEMSFTYLPDEDDMAEYTSTAADGEAERSNAKGKPRLTSGVISISQDVEQLVMVKNDQVGIKKDGLTVAVKGAADITGLGGRLVWEVGASLKSCLTLFAVMMVISMSAYAGLFGHTKAWKEEVLLHDGRIMVVERAFKLGGYPALEAQERSPLDQTISFTLPGKNKKISWVTEYRDDKPEPNSLGALLLDVMDGVPYLATSPAGCIAYNKWGRPNPPYVLFKYVNDKWQQIPLKDFPRELAEANLMGIPASKLLKPYYNVEASKAERNSGNVSAYAKTILREPLKIERCPQYSSSPKAPISVVPSTSTK